MGVFFVFADGRQLSLRVEQGDFLAETLLPPSPSLFSLSLSPSLLLPPFSLPPPFLPTPTSFSSSPALPHTAWGV